MPDEDDTADEAVTDLAAAVAAADSVVALTGAGLSTASGVPDFRSEGGIWDRFDKRDFVYRKFVEDPATFWANRVELHEAMFEGDVEPNAAHEALATMEDEGDLDALLTQNVDGLHEAAGSEDVVRLHGTAAYVVCQGCEERKPADPIHERAQNGELPPTCETCGGVYKPDVVLFGEQLPQGALQRARQLATEADLFLALGTSLAVEPVASLPRQAATSGATIAVCNLDKTRASESAAFDLRADVTDVLPTLVDALAAE